MIIIPEIAFMAISFFLSLHRNQKTITTILYYIMTQEDKDLLFKDLSSRLPYHVKVKVWLKDGTTEEGFLDLEHNYADVLRNAFYYNEIKDIKPYLFPLSSMSEEQKREYQYITERWMYDSSYSIGDSIDWLNKNHFDYRGLIPMGLAIDATGLNIY